MKPEELKKILDRDLESVQQVNIITSKRSTGFGLAYEISIINREEKEKYKYTFYFNNEGTDFEWYLDIMGKDYDRDKAYACSEDGYFYVAMERFKPGIPLKTFLTNLTNEIIESYIDQLNKIRVYTRQLLLEE